jgi:hypothetical protein
MVVSNPVAKSQKLKPVPKTATERYQKHKLLHPVRKRKEDPAQVKERSRRRLEKQKEARNDELARNAAIEQQLADALSRLDLNEREHVAKDAEIYQLQREAAAMVAAIDQLEGEVAAMEQQEAVAKEDRAADIARTASLDIELVAARARIATLEIQAAINKDEVACGSSTKAIGANTNEALVR